MKLRLNPLYVLLSISMLLVSCAQVNPLSKYKLGSGENAIAVNLTQQITDPFLDALRAGYITLAEQKLGGKHQNYFHQKAGYAVSGIIPPTHDIIGITKEPADLRLFSYHSNFLNRMTYGDLRMSAPGELAKARLLFDCWARQYRSIPGDKEQHACRDEYLSHHQILVDTFQRIEQQKKRAQEEKVTLARQEIESLKQNLEKLSTAAATPKFTPPPLPKPYVVFFGYNETDINFKGMNIIEKISQEVGYYMPTKILISGHTDRSGSQKYNKSLAHKRALNVALQLTQKGVNSNLLDLRSYGESAPMVETKDGKAEKHNRYVKISFLHDNRVYYKPSSGASSRNQPPKSYTTQPRPLNAVTGAPIPLPN